MAIATQHVTDPRNAPTKVLILGSSGMVGRSWVQLLKSRRIPYRALQRPAIDLLEPTSLYKAIEADDTLVVNAAAWTDVDGAESDVDTATTANGHAVGQLARRCSEIGSTLIHYSTDYVFAGDAKTPYPIDAAIDPVNIYGQSKALGEELVRQFLPENHLLVRTSWVYAPWGNNFVRTMLKLQSEREMLRVVNDQRGRPTSAQELAESSLKLYLAGALGTWHSTDSGECTWFEFAKAIASINENSCIIEACPSSEYPRPAKRPGYSTLDISATTELIGAATNWLDALDRCIQEIKN